MSGFNGSHEDDSDYAETVSAERQQSPSADSVVEQARALAAQIVARQLAQRAERTRAAEAARPDVLDMRTAPSLSENE